MIKRQELIRLAKEAIDLEEKSIPIYMNHLKAAIFWLGLGESRVKEVKEAFAHLAKASARHKEMIGDILKTIEESDKDAF